MAVPSRGISWGDQTEIDVLLKSWSMPQAVSYEHGSTKTPSLEVVTPMKTGVYAAYKYLKRQYPGLRRDGRKPLFSTFYIVIKIEPQKGARAQIPILDQL